MNGFAIVRGGILDHLVAGRLGYPELGIYTVIHLQADFRTGIWWGSAPRLLATSPRGASIRDVQRWLQTLKRIRFLRPFHKHGERGNYPVLIDKYFVRIGALSGTRLNAWKSESWNHPCYESCALPVADDDAVTVALAAPSSVFSSQEESKPCENPSGFALTPSLPPAEKTMAAQELEQAVRRVWVYYLEKLGKNPNLLSLTDARMRKGLARLRECLKKTAGHLAKAEELMQIAVDAISESAWHMGGNASKKRYDSWERNLFPSQEKLESWLSES
jgi:hypothetical protein